MIENLTGKKYLEQNLMSLIEKMKMVNSDSYILESLGIFDKPSLQSINIQFGIKIETFWNKVISDSNATNLIENNNLIKIGDNNKQQDHFFSVEEKYYYLESKCNLNLDSEKIKASNQKIKEIQNKHSDKLDNIVVGYFVPVKPIIPNDIIKKYKKSNINVYGVNWLFSVINIPFSQEEYFLFLKNEVRNKLIEKGL